jgi:hypothetical protein
MHSLDSKFSKRLTSIAKAIQGSDELAAYLDTEEADEYKALQEAFEPQLAELHKEVNDNYPLQTLALEEALLNGDLEGLFIPRILGYSVLRGELNEICKYVRPQLHFRKILRSICESANFDLIKQRIGQSVQMGFAMSSDIWVTGLISEVDNKKIRFYLQNLISNRFRDPVVRRGAYNRYLRQFTNINYLTVDIPKNKAELTNGINNLVRFLEARDQYGLSHETYKSELIGLLQQKELWDSIEYVRLASTLLKMKQAGDEIHNEVIKAFNTLRAESTKFNESYFGLLEEILKSQEDVDEEFDKKMATLLDASIKDDMLDFYQLMEIMHSKGYIHDDTIDAVRKFYNSYEGLSTINECLRQTVSGYFARLLRNLDVEAYHDYFELNKIFAIYMNLFSNEAFNQSVKRDNLQYVKRLLKRYTDKRSRDYQDIKKFVSLSFLDMHFMTEKEIVELFKTRRKKKTA